jgi:hypothetical protein
MFPLSICNDKSHARNDSSDVTILFNSGEKNRTNSLEFNPDK